MRILYLTAILFTILVSCDNEEHHYYKQIDEATYLKYKTIDTLYKSKDFIATNCEDTIKFFKAHITLIKKLNGDCFLLDPDSYFESGSRIICYSSPLKSDSEIGSFQKNGLWFYAHFYVEKTDSTGLYQESVGGVKYVVDSIPLKGQYLARPTAEGIYFYKNGSLVKVSSEQSEEEFFNFKKDGFYFLPVSGRFFKRYSVQSMN
jgi:hypothetical protein